MIAVFVTFATEGGVDRDRAMDVAEKAFVEVAALVENRAAVPA